MQQGTPLNVVQEIGDWKSAGMVRRYRILRRHTWQMMKPTDNLSATAHIIDI